jgi:predicted nucleic acid-binding protein
LSQYRIAFDSNILVYLTGLQKTPEDEAKIAASRALHIKLAVRCDCVLPLQAVGELFTVLQRAGVDRQVALKLTREHAEKFEQAGASADVFDAALELASSHKLQFWDALILNVAADAGCSLLLSEDLQDGFAWRGVTVVNPFTKKLHKRLARVLAG